MYVCVRNLTTDENKNEKKIIKTTTLNKTAPPHIFYFSFVTIIIGFLLR